MLTRVLVIACFWSVTVAKGFFRRKKSALHQCEKEYPPNQIDQCLHYKALKKDCKCSKGLFWWKTANYRRCKKDCDRSALERSGLHRDCHGHFAHDMYEISDVHGEYC